MAQDKGHSEGAGGGRPEEDKTKGIDGPMEEDTCRCKEVSKKTLPEMFKLMLGDLAFWKRRGKQG